MRARTLTAAMAVLLLAACGSPSSAPETPASGAASPASQQAADDAPTGPPETFTEMLDRVGIEPENIASFEEFATESLCESEMQAFGPGFSNEVQVWGVDNPEAGRSPELVRYVISESCPERAGDAEEILGAMD